MGDDGPLPILPLDCLFTLFFLRLDAMKTESAHHYARWLLLPAAECVVV